MTETDIALLKWYADKDDCDGSCDEKSPHKPCPQCLARYTLNEIGKTVRDTIKEIEKMVNTSECPDLVISGDEIWYPLSHSPSYWGGGE